jgi:DNA repair photolyase
VFVLLSLGGPGMIVAMRRDRDEREERAERQRTPAPIRGRGALRNVKSRYDRRETVPVPGEADGASTPRTVWIADDPRSIIATNDSPDVPFDQSINPYRGCEHGCVYCFARPTHAWLGLSPGLDFETRILFKRNAADLLRRELSRKSYECRPLALGSNTDPYQPAESRLRITREILELLAEHDHPVTVVTKSALVTRDLDLLAAMARRRLAAVYFSVTTLDPDLARTMEPRAAAPARRIETLAAVAGSGVPTGVLASPMIPGLNDAELERILEAAARAGARTAGYLLVRLPHEVKEIFTEWLETHYPARASKVLNLLRDMRGGSLNDPRFDLRHTGQGPLADLLRRRFEVACRRLALSTERPELDRSSFRRPSRQGTLF